MKTHLTLINVNGELLPPERATVSVFDRGFLYGDSIYEVTMTYKKRPLLLEAHLDRLWRSALWMEMPLPYTREEMTIEIEKGINALGLDRIYIRVIITRGEGDIGLDPALSGGTNLYIIFKELPEYPREWYEKGVHMIVADVMRNPKRAIDPNVKSGNYLNNVMAMVQAKREGAFDAIMLNHKGQVTEATTSNLWIVRNGELSTPPVGTGLLGGITRSVLLKLCRQHGIVAREENFTAQDMKNADECFLTSSTKELVPIVKIDQSSIGSGAPGAMSQKLHALYREFVLSGL